jgi:uncharacterized protein (DUF1778 family)
MESVVAYIAPVSVRVSAQEREVLEAAAKQARTNLSDFIRRKAVEAAETDLFFAAAITIPPENWDRFEAFARAPARTLPGLSELARTEPAWRE